MLLHKSKKRNSIALSTIVESNIGRDHVDGVHGLPPPPPPKSPLLTNSMNFDRAVASNPGSYIQFPPFYLASHVITNRIGVPGGKSPSCLAKSAYKCHNSCIEIDRRVRSATGIPRSVKTNG